MDLIADLSAPGAAATAEIESLDIDTEDCRNLLDIGDYKIDAGVNGEKCKVTYWRA